MRGLTLISLLFLLRPAVGAVTGEPKTPYQDLPADRPCRHVEAVQASPHDYDINLQGTVDGTMTRMPIGYAAFVQGWQPNRSFVIENIGTTDVLNPRIVVNGKRNWITLESVVAEATCGYSKPADRARAIWEYQRRQRFHACTWDAECSDALKVLNVYGYTLCGNEALVISDLWKAAGFQTRRGYPIGHVVSEVYYDGTFHLLDSDEHVICLLRDNKTIASCAQVVRDHDLIKRTHTYGIGNRENRKTDEFSASLYSYEGERKGDFGTNTKHSMDLVLRPGESIEFRWDHVGKEYSAGSDPAEGQRLRDGLGSLARWGPTAYDNLRNGMLRYRPDLSSDLGAETADNASLDTARGAVRPADADRPAAVTWLFASPYAFVGGKATARFRLDSGSLAQWQYSDDNKTWQVLAAAGEKREPTLTASLDRVVSTRRKPTYRFWLRLVLGGNAQASDIAFQSDIQTSLLSLPELEVGNNRIAYSDANAQPRSVRITHQWIERLTWQPPSPPEHAISPQDGQTREGTQVIFRWSPAVDPDGDAVVDYHFELSEHDDMRWPLSPNFERLTSLTASKGGPTWTVPYVGLLNPDTTYYWRVRARDARGVWGDWSKTFQFRAKAPGVPLDLKLAPDTKGGFTLHWRPNPRGETPARYRIYGSDQRGFSASDTETSVFRGRGFCQTMDEFEKKPEGAPDAGLVKTPANLITEAYETFLRVAGAGLELPNTNKAFYRVVAVDGAGNQSGPSDYAEVPRPHVWNRPDPQASVGDPLRFEPRVIRSIGDLRCRRSPNSSYNAAFWDREESTFLAVRIPKGLCQDPDTGVVTGRFSQPGRFEIVFAVSDQFGKNRTCSYHVSVVGP